MTSYTPIAKVVLGSNSVDMQFTSIPGTYTDLVLLVSIRTSRTPDTADEVHIQFNSDTGNNYSSRALRSTGSAAGATINENTSAIKRMWMASGNSPSDTFGSGQIYIQNYSSSAINKVVSISSVQGSNTAQQYVSLISSIWTSNSPITSIKLFSETSNNLIAGSSAYLYGITKAV